MCCFGYYKSMEGVCFPLTEKNKLTCHYSLNSYTFCTHCKERILAKAGKCTGDQRCADPGCAVCYLWDHIEACELCLDGYFLLGPTYKTAKCTLATPETRGCYYSNSTTQCLDCIEGYYFVNHRCVATPLTVMASAKIFPLTGIFFGFIFFA